MNPFEIPYYHDTISPALAGRLLDIASPVPGVESLREVGPSGGLETAEAFAFLRDLYLELKDELNTVLSQRVRDRAFIDQRVKAGADVIGLMDAEGRVVIGPLTPNYARPGGEPIQEIPPHLQGPHVTLFGPPDSAKMAINAMNAFHRKLPTEPPVVSTLLAQQTSVPKWGADDEDSKTPLRADLVDAAQNLTACFEGTLRVHGPKEYVLADDHRSIPIKRFPGLALPCTFLFCEGNPIPLHLYDFALHLFHNWHNPEALTFYVPKLETEEEAAYIHHMVSATEQALHLIHPDYRLGSVRLMIVLENPRAILRTHEIMDALHPYFVGASLGWHDYLASTARIFKEKPAYRIPVKSDPDIVIKYIKASHRLLADVVGSRGGIKVGGMYGILPLDNDPRSDSFQMTLVGFVKDVITQMKRDLTGFWVAHPDFVRLGIALVEAWKQHVAGHSSPLETLVQSLVVEAHHQDILAFIHGDDIEGLSIEDPDYVESLIVSGIGESDFIANNHPDEIRYNVFQSLQYLTDWLSGNGCVALPAIVNRVPVRVMDDLATAERSRWEVWHQLHHGLFPLDAFIRIAHEEMRFIRKDLSTDQKIVQVKYTEVSARWYPIAFRLMLKLMTDDKPLEFATELLLPFTVEEIRTADDPMRALQAIDPGALHVAAPVERLHRYFEACGCERFAREMARLPVMDLARVQESILSFDRNELRQAMSFHGTIGESKARLDAHAATEQAGVISDSNEIREALREGGTSYQERFGFPFLVSAKGKSGAELLQSLRQRMERSREQEIHTAKEVLWEITRKRLEASPLDSFLSELPDTPLNIAINEHGQTQEFVHQTAPGSLFEVASLSKTLASAFAIEYFARNNIPLDTKVNTLLTHYQIPDGDEVTLEHLMSHRALDMHYVRGYPHQDGVQPIKDLLTVKVIHPPGEVFSYSGGGFLVLQYLIEEREGRPIAEVTRPFFETLGLDSLSFDPSHPGDRLDFPAFAAGALGTAGDMARFLNTLAEAYANVDGARGIRHDSAVHMLHGRDLGSLDFIGAQVGLGTFIAEAGDNKLCLHQGANEGYRALYLHCVSGPDAGKGFVIFATGDNEAVPIIARLAQKLLIQLGISGVAPHRFITDFDASRTSQEQIVNQGYKTMVFDAFEPCLPPRIEGRGQEDEGSADNLACTATIIRVTNQKFGRAENLISPHKPIFDPAEFCGQGKVMDSWETERHNERPFHCLELDLERESTIRFVSLSTEYHDGNHVEAVEIEGVLPKTSVEGHAQLNLRLAEPAIVKRLNIKAYPDGGLTRLGLYESVPDPNPFDGISRRFSHAIPKVTRPMTIPFEAEGIRVSRVSNEHYGEASHVLSPYPPLHMFDGFESARSRRDGHFEEIEFHLDEAVPIRSVLFDFTFFKNNAPVALSIQGKLEGDWVELQPRTQIKAYAGNQKRFTLPASVPFDQLRVRIYPDGGINRIRING